MNPTSPAGTLTRRRLLPLLAAAAIAALAGCSTTPTAPGTPQPALLAHLDAVVRQSDSARAVVAEALPAQLAVGQPLRLNLASAAPGHVYVFQLGTSGQLGMLFPNSVDGANQVAAGQVLALPRPQWTMTARGPAGLAYVVAVVADKPQDLLALQRALAEQRIAVEGAYGAAMVTVRETAR